MARGKGGRERGGAEAGLTAMWLGGAPEELEGLVVVEESSRVLFMAKYKGYSEHNAKGGRQWNELGA